MRARLQTLARAERLDFQRTLTRYGNERVLYRLSASAHGDKFVLKGATLFTVWTARMLRATKDVDLLGFGDPSDERLKAVFTDVLSMSSDDGLTFDLSTLRIGPIREDSDYGGQRITFEARLDAARFPLQFDVGFGDAIEPGPIVVELPSLLEFPAAKLRSYRRETVVAEKCEAMVKLGIANSRLKDFFDLWVLARDFDFDGMVLTAAMRATFNRRGTHPRFDLPAPLTLEYAGDRQRQLQWQSFVKRVDAADAKGLEATMALVREFLSQPLRSLASSESFEATWRRGGPWAAGAPNR